MLRLIVILAFLFSALLPVSASAGFAGTGYASVAAGLNWTVVVKSDGTLWTWGNNQYGQQGNVTANQSNVPLQVGSDSNWLSAAAGNYTIVALKNDGTLWAWGNNMWGQLGDGSTTDRHTPVQVGTANNWAVIAAGADHTLAIKTDGTLWAWGGNGYGQVGDGSKTQRTSPVQIGTDTDWASAAGGYYHSVAIKHDGSLWAWGDNSSGQLGDGSTVDHLVPTRVGSATDWASVSSGEEHNIALKSDGSLWAWGFNASGQLGNGTTTDSNVLIQIGSDHDWAMVSAHYDLSLALKNSGAVFGWGWNPQGQVGDGTTTDRSSPVQIASGFAAITAGTHTGTGIYEDGSLWNWGYNGWGQFGDGTDGINAGSLVPKLCLPPIGSVTVSVASGWNLLGNGTTGTVDVTKTFGDTSKVNTVWKWIPGNNGGWAFYTPALNDGGAAYARGRGFTPLTSIDAGEGFWVNATQAFSATFGTGNTVPSTRFADGYTGNALPSGWSLIAVGDNPSPRYFANDISLNPPTTGNRAATSILSLWAWRPGVGWYFYAPSLDNAGTLGSYILSHSLLDFTLTGKSLDKTTGFWVSHP